MWRICFLSLLFLLGCGSDEVTNPQELALLFSSAEVSDPPDTPFSVTGGVGIVVFSGSFLASSTPAQLSATFEKIDAKTVVLTVVAAQGHNRSIAHFRYSGELQGLDPGTYTVVLRHSVPVLDSEEVVLTDVVVTR